RQASWWQLVFSSRSSSLPLVEFIRSPRAPSGGPRCALIVASFADADAGVLDHRPPLVHFRLEKLPELRRRRAEHEQADLLATSLDRGIVQRRRHVGVYFSHDRRPT